MKNALFLLLFCSFFTNQIKAQNAPDFTVTTVHGETFNLYDKLDEGKYVFIDFFFTTCQPCIDIIPYVNTIFENYGCNNGEEIYFISIDVGDTDAEVLQFEEDYGGKLPAASGEEGGGNVVADLYDFNAFPRLILISPDKEIVENIFPPTLENMSNAISSHGISTDPEACETVSSVTDLITDKLQVFPNPVANNLTVTWEDTETESVRVNDIFGKVITVIDVTGTDGRTQIDMGSFPKGTYVLTTNTSKGIKGRILFQRM